MSASKKKNTNEQKPISSWGYYGYDLLYAIPIIGTIIMIVFALDDSNIARRNYTRSKFIPFLIWDIFIVAALIFAFVVYAKNGWL